MVLLPGSVCAQGNGFQIQSLGANGRLTWTSASIGISWTNIACGEVTVNTIEASELVTVPLGTFNCLRVRKQQVNASHPNPVWIEWWQPGFGQVQWIDYFLEASDNPPVVHRLTARGVGP